MNVSRKSLFLVMAIMSAASPVFAADSTTKTPAFMANALHYTKTGAKLGASAFFVWSVVTFLMREPDNNPVRYSLEELKQGKNLRKNLKYLILDGLIGHKSKRPSLRVYPDNKVSPELCESYNDLNPSHSTGALVIRPGAYAKGIYGNVYDYAKPTCTAVALLYALDKLSNSDANKAARAIFAWIDPSSAALVNNVQ